MSAMKELQTVTFHMKSGQKVVADRVEPGFKVFTQGDTVTQIAGWKQHRPRNRLMLTALALGQIEAITYSPTWSLW